MRLCAILLLLLTVPSADSAPPPGVVVAARQQIDDPNDEAQYGDRIMYLVPRRATKNERLANRAVSPHEFIRDRMHLDAQYYIERMIIPPLSRVLRLAGVLDVKAWYKNMPKTVRVERDERESGTAQTKLEKHFQSSMCISCGHSGMLTKGMSLPVRVCSAHRCPQACARHVRLPGHRARYASCGVYELSRRATARQTLCARRALGRCLERRSSATRSTVRGSSSGTRWRMRRKSCLLCAQPYSTWTRRPLAVLSETWCVL